MRPEEFARHNRPPLLGLDRGSLPRLEGLLDSWSYALVDLKLPAGFDLRLERGNLRWYRHAKKSDKTTVIYNQRIPLEACVVNGKAALDWVMERQCVKTEKASGIVNDTTIGP